MEERQDQPSSVFSVLCAVTAARLSSRIICPHAAILFKWLVIRYHQPDQYRMWSGYHLRGRDVNLALRNCGKGLRWFRASSEH